MKSNVKRKTILTAMSMSVALAAAGHAFADTPLASWTIHNTDALDDGVAGLAPASTASGITVSNLLMGPGPIANNTASTFGAAGFGEQATEAGAVLNGDYVNMAFTAASGNAESFTSVSAYNIRRSATGPTTGIWQYEIGAGSFVDIGSAITWGSTTSATGNAESSISLSGIAALQNVAPGVTVTFRIVTWGDTGSGGTWYVNGAATSNNLVINGTLAAYAGGNTTLLWTGGSAAWNQSTAQWQNLAANDTIWSNSTNGSATTASFNTGSTITLDAGGITANGLNFQAGSNGISLSGPGTLTLTGPGIFVAPATTATINSQLSGSAGINVQGGGTVVLSNTTNNFSGTISLMGGAISVNADSQLGNSSNNLVFSGGTLQTTASITTARGFSGGAILNIAPGTTLASTGTFSTSTVTLSNTGTLDIQGSSPAVGALTSNVGGTLTSSTGQNLTLTAMNVATLSGTLTVSTSGAISLATPGTSGFTMNVGASGDVVLNGTLSAGAGGTGTLTKSGAGIMELLGNNGNSLVRLSMSTGTVKINSVNSLGEEQMFFNGGTLDATTDLTSSTGNAMLMGFSLGAQDPTIATLAGSNMEFAGVSNLYETTGKQNHLSVQNTTIISGTFSNGTSAGYVASGLTIDGGGTFWVNSSGDASGMTRATTVNGTGTTLQVDGKWGSAITVNTGASLKGGGTISGAVAIASGATISPGSTTNTMTINSTVSLAGTADFQLDASAMTSGKIASNNILTYGGNLKVEVPTGTLALGDAWTLFSFASETGAFANDSQFDDADGSGSGGLFPTLTGGLKWFFNYSTGVLSISNMGSGGPPPSLLWTGGNSAWDQTNARWDHTGTNDTIWSNSTNGNATAAEFNTGSTVSVDSGGITANGLTFEAGSNGVTIGGPGILTLDSSIVSVDPSATATITAQLAGTAGLNILGGGTLVLANTSNSFSGTISPTVGTLSISDDRQLGNGGNAIVLNGGTLQTTASLNTARSITGTGSINVAGSTTLASTGTFNVTTLTLSGSGTLDLQGSSPNVGSLIFTGGTTLTSSTGQQIVATGIDATSLNGTATISSAGGLNLGTGTVTVNVGSTGDLVIQAPLTLAGSGNTSLKKTGTGTMELDGTNTGLFRIQIGSESTTVPVAGGTVIISNNQALGTNQLFLNGGTLQATTDMTGTNALTIGVSIGGLDNNPAVFAGSNMEFAGASDIFQPSSAAPSHITVNNTTTISGAFSAGTGSATGLTVDGTGTLVFNTDTSGMTLATTVGGTATLAVNHSYGAPVSVGSGATLQASGTATTIAGSTLSNNGTFAVTGTGSNVTTGAVAGAGNTTVAAGASLTATQITQNTLTVNGAAAIAQSVTPNSNTSVVSSLVIGGTTNAWTGTLDIGNNSLVISNGGSGVTGQNVTRQVTNQIQSGLNINGTLWAGTGITSSAAAADASLTHGVGVIQNNAAGATVGDGTTTDQTPGNEIYTTFEGQAVSLNDTLVKYTWFGDADLSGVIDSTDYFLIDNGFANGLSGWINGDFDYSGTIDSTDYFLIDNAFANQSGPLSAAFVLSQPFGAQNYQALLALGEIAGTPEPTSLALLGLGAVGLLARRKRRS